MYVIISSCLTANPATALQPGRFEDSSMNPARLLWGFIFIEFWVPWWCWICSYCAAWCNGHRNRLHFWRGPRVPKWYPGTSKFNKNEPSQVGLRIHFHWILGSLVVQRMKVSFPLMFLGIVCSGVCRNTDGKRHLVVFLYDLYWGPARLVWGLIFIETWASW